MELLSNGDKYTVPGTPGLSLELAVPGTRCPWNSPGGTHPGVTDSHQAACESEE